MTERVIRRHALQSGTDTLFHVLGPLHSFSFSTLNWPGLGAGRVDFRFAYVSNKQSISLALKNTAASSARRPWEKKKNETQSHSASTVGRKPLATLCKSCVGTSLIATHHRIRERNRRRPTSPLAVTDEVRRTQLPPMNQTNKGAFPVNFFFCREGSAKRRGLCRRAVLNCEEGLCVS